MSLPGSLLAADPQWESFAAREPYFSVLTAPRFRRANLTPDVEREFFASGERIVEWLFRVVESLSPQFAPASTLEFGCGVGRLALPLARRPGSVTAVDRSPAMLTAAREEAGRQGLSHITFQTPRELFDSPRTFDLVVCYHVLQRMPRQEAMTVLEALAERIGPGGIGVFQWPVRNEHSALVSGTRWVREKVPGANTVANRLRHNAGDDPFVPTHVFPLQEILGAFDFNAFATRHVVFERHDESLEYAIAFTKRTDQSSLAIVTTPSQPAAGAGLKDVSDAEIDRFNETAETYFSSLTNWDFHLAKPFSNPEETPTLLKSVSVVLEAMKLAPGLRVLEFGAGTGWLSSWLTEMGCQAILLDVSPTALKIAEELYRRRPPSNERPAPEFLVFDGRRINLPDASVDRVICFDAFHHAANPDAVIREFARVLKPGGIAAFAEPGPRHSDSPQSQFEANTYGVVELDVDVHAIWRSAQQCGFTDIRMCVFHGQPYQVSLQEFEDFLAGGKSQEPWVASTRQFLRYVRNFCLVKGGAERLDSRFTEGLKCEVRPSSTTLKSAAGMPITIEATVTNSGTATWLSPRAGRGGVRLGSHLYDSHGGLLTFDHVCEDLTQPPRDIAPGETLRVFLTVPPLSPGRYKIELDCVASHVKWFAQVGSRPPVVTLEVQ
jgi:2-polyprenyl-3-methyl-5-hydroxy-6-metoxy-1,4-benzoquinol methylase